ncbi:MAG: hypothetical protein KDD37_08850, partial [Bdellovibrionales bacterium]|nr:hypothetical protein [Bdellovibrionales bacterium]
MKLARTILLGFILLQAFSSVAKANPYKVYQPCSKKEVLRGRDDIPKIKALYSCHQADNINVEAIDPLTKVDSSDFDFKRTKEAQFCVALLNEHRQGTELYFNGQLSYVQGKKEKVKEVQASALYQQDLSQNKQYRMVHQLSAGEFRPTKDSIRIYQEDDIGKTVDVKLDQKSNTASLLITESGKNRKAE